MQNTNVTGKHKVGFALRVIKGIGRRFAILVCKIAQIDLDRRAGTLNEEEMNKIADIFAKPLGKLSLLVYGAFTWAVCRLRNSKMVLEQTKVHQGGNLHSALLQHGRYQTQRGSRAHEEGPQAQRSQTLLGTQGQRSEDQVNWKNRKDPRCRQEEEMSPTPYFQQVFRTPLDATRCGLYQSCSCLLHF